jgi:putative transposase
MASFHCRLTALRFLVSCPAYNPWNSECPPRCSVALGRPMPPLVLSDGEVQQLQGIGNSRSLPHSILQRAQIVLACWAGETNTAIAKRMGLTGLTVGKWRKRYRELGLEGLHDELRPGRPRTYADDKVAEVINRSLQTKPTVHRWLQTFSVQPHRQKTYRSAAVLRLQALDRPLLR